MLKLAALPSPIMASTTIQSFGSRAGRGSSSGVSTSPMRRILARPIRSERRPIRGDVKVWARAIAAKQRPMPEGPRPSRWSKSSGTVDSSRPHRHEPRAMAPAKTRITGLASSWRKGRRSPRSGSISGSRKARPAASRATSPAPRRKGAADPACWARKPEMGGPIRTPRLAAAKAVPMARPLDSDGKWSASSAMPGAPSRASSGLPQRNSATSATTPSPHSRPITCGESPCACQWMVPKP